MRQQFPIINSIIAAIFAVQTLLIVPQVQAQQLPEVGSMISLTPAFQPALMVGMSVNPSDPFQFEFFVDGGEQDLAPEAFKQLSVQFIKYFMAALTVPEEEMWVNLSPGEHDRIIPPDFSRTAMGRDLLAEDYMLKQLTASLMHPDTKSGGEFWRRIYAKAEDIDVSVETINKVWIVPETADVFVQGNNVFVVDSHLKVMLEDDYTEVAEADRELKREKQIIRDVLIPEIEREVNEGRTFTKLRQVYNALILATWYKKNLKQSFFAKTYVDQHKTGGIEIPDEDVDLKIYNQYMEALQVGVFSLIKEEVDPVTQEIFPRKYFSGGIDYAAMEAVTREVESSVSAADLSRFNRLQKVDVNMAPADQAMVADSEEPVSTLEELRDRTKPEYRELLEILAEDEFIGFEALRDSYNDRPLRFSLGIKEVMQFDPQGSARSAAEALNRLIDQLDQQRFLPRSEMIEVIGRDAQDAIRFLLTIHENQEFFEKISDEDSIGHETLANLFLRNAGHLNVLMNTLIQSGEFFDQFIAGVGASAIRPALYDNILSFIELYENLPINRQIWDQLLRSEVVGRRLVQRVLRENVEGLMHGMAFLSYKRPRVQTFMANLSEMEAMFGRDEIRNGFLHMPFEMIYSVWASDGYLSAINDYQDEEGDVDLNQVLRDNGRTLFIKTQRVATLNAIAAFREKMGLDDELLGIGFLKEIDDALAKKRFPTIERVAPIEERQPGEIEIDFIPPSGIGGRQAGVFPVNPWKSVVAESEERIDKQGIRRSMGLEGDRPLIVVASPRKEEMVDIASFYRQMKDAGRNPLLVVGVRFDKDQYAEFFEAEGITNIGNRMPGDMNGSFDGLASGEEFNNFEVVILRTRGELATLLKASDVSIISRDHNLFEPMGYSPILYFDGQWTHNSYLRRHADVNNAAEPIEDLFSQVSILLNNKEVWEKHLSNGRKAKDVFDQEIMGAAKMTEGVSLAAHIMQQSGVAPDNAMMADPASDTQNAALAQTNPDALGANETPGGIDMNPSRLLLNVEGDAIEFTLPDKYQNIDFNGVNGFTPVINAITPIPNLPLFLGQREESESSDNPQLSRPDVQAVRSES